MRIVVLFLAAVAAWGAITNECQVVRMDGSTGPCRVSDVSYGSIRWGAVITLDDSYAEANLGYSQTLTFVGPRAGTTGYIALYAYDFFTHYSAQSGGSYAQIARSNLPMTKTLDNSSQFVEPDPGTLIPITFGTPIDLRVWVNDAEGGHPEGTQYIDHNFTLLQINVYDRSQRLWAELQPPTTEYAEMQVPVHAPEPATVGITAVGVLSFLAASRRCRKTSRG